MGSANYHQWAMDDKFKTPPGRMLHLEEIIPFIKEWTGARTKDEIYHPAQEPGCTITPVTTAEDLVNSQQSNARGFFLEIDHPDAGRFKYPTWPFIFSETPAEIEYPAPLLGEPNEEIYIKRLGYSRHELVQMIEAGII